MRLKSLILVASVLTSPAMASVSMSTGSGSAVTTVDASANFEQEAALAANYVEDGLAFSRVNLSDNNNGCGYAGCDGHPGFTGFSGNYFYGVGGGYLSIKTTGGDVFSGLEFVIGSGYFESTMSFNWEALLGGVSVANGSSTQAVGTVVGFSGGAFDELRFTNGAPAIDTVVADLNGNAVPEPASWAMMIGGFALAGAAMRGRKAAVSFA